MEQNVQKAEQMKYRLADAMKQCMAKMPIERITVRQLVELSGTTRQTFYRHFQDKYDLINWYFDKLLAKHGYERHGKIYRAVNANNDTIVLFCHFGLECVLLSHLLGISPMVLWHGFCAAPTSVTTLYTEERRRGIAAFRMASFGDISHLYAANEEPAFAARFCECYDNPNERHD